MSRGSLRLRLIAGGFVAILIALTIAGAGLTLLFERHVTRTIGDDLDVYLKQLLAGIDVDARGKLMVGRPPADPRFADPLSGLYWQVSDDDGQVLRSRSLWDTALDLPQDEPSPGELHRHVILGPANARLLVSERRVLLTVSDRRAPVRVAVAGDLARASAAAAQFAKDLVLALGLLSLVLAVATSIQVGLGLRPLDALRRGVADVRSGQRKHLPVDVPAEVKPLVEEVNSLIDAQEREIERSRSRAADLAHGLKTPLAALAADVALLRRRGEQDVAQAIESVGDAMSRHVDRELARARARGTARQRGHVSTPLRPLVESLMLTLARTSTAQRLEFRTCITGEPIVPLDRTDLAEVLGNLLENAARHAKSQVRIGADATANPAITVEDDGPGIASAERGRVLERGARLDERGEGTGLGLAIVQDVLSAYHWQLVLSDSELGGLKAIVTPEGSRDRMAALGQKPGSPAQEGRCGWEQPLR
ncbi:periplasmic sensor signal transduction histidine kinase [Bradyrhizobium sp.]|uniref:sensor histidine kinase n=1 Tax=Bradyrhizobium sp. TaxID=376 RepID=UPI0007C1AD92|nr:HAMP domain-containing sensor histidine kinase [Bradyrhizobium sp.]CUT09862.1 periplasmic sensor signal transduction histidine kinase [Bradyrhizobium sp.]